VVIYSYVLSISHQQDFTTGFTRYLRTTISQLKTFYFSFSSAGNSRHLKCVILPALRQSPASSVHFSLVRVVTAVERYSGGRQPKSKEGQREGKPLLKKGI